MGDAAGGGNHDSNARLGLSDSLGGQRKKWMLLIRGKHESLSSPPLDVSFDFVGQVIYFIEI